MIGGEPELARELVRAAFHYHEVSGAIGDDGEAIKLPAYVFPDKPLTLGKHHNRRSGDCDSEGEPIVVNIKECMTFLTEDVEMNWNLAINDTFFDKHKETIHSLAAAKETVRLFNTWKDGEIFAYADLYGSSFQSHSWFQSHL